MVGWFQRSILKCYTCPRSLATYSHAAPFSPKKEDMCANADASTMTLSAFKMSYTFKCETSVCTTRSMFRALFATFSLASLVMTYAFSEAPTPHAIKDLLNAFVPGAEMLPEISSTTIIALAADCNAVAIANRRSFLFILIDQSRGFGPNDTPPPGLSGVRLEPARALPVPFCLNGFLPPPRTSLFVSVLAVPCVRKKVRQSRRSSSWITTPAE